MTVSEQSHSGTEAYEVAVAVVPIEQNVKEGNQQTPGVPGFDEAWGRSSGDHAAGRSILIEKGETAVRTATEAIASQIGIAAQRIAESIENQSWPTAQPGSARRNVLSPRPFKKPSSGRARSAGRRPCRRRSGRPGYWPRASLMTKCASL